MKWTNLVEQINKIQIKSITDSLFRYAALFLVIAVFASICQASTFLIILLAIIGGLFVMTGLFFYCFFSIKNPDYLRSESFHISKKSIEILGDKENLINPNIKDVVLIANPYASELSSGSNNIEIK